MSRRSCEALVSEARAPGGSFDSGDSSLAKKTITRRTLIDSFSVVIGLLRHFVFAFLISSSLGLRAGTPVSASKPPDRPFILCFLRVRPQNDMKITATTRLAAPGFGNPACMQYPTPRLPSREPSSHDIHGKSPG